MSRWTKATIRDLVDDVATWNPLRSSLNDTFNYIDLSAIDQDSKIVTGVREILCSEAPSRARQLVNKGDVLISTVRPNLNGVARVSPELDGATASTGFCVLRPLPDVLAGSYLFHWVKSPVFIDDMVRKATGASYPAVSDRIVAESQIPLPPLEEQKRIAEILDRAESLRAMRRQSIEQLNTLTQAIFLEMFGDPVANPKNVKTALLATVCKRVTDGTHQPPKWSNSGHPFLFVSNIVSGEITFDTAKFISSETHEELTRRCPIEVGDVLYSTVGSYGVPVLVKTQRKFAFQRHIAHIKPDSNIIDSQFLCTMLASPSLKNQADRAARGVAQKTVNLEEIRKFMVFCPQLTIQQEFTQRVEAIEKLKATHQKSLTELDALFASLQHRAFRGEL